MKLGVTARGRRRSLPGYPWLAILPCRSFESNPRRASFTSRVIALIGECRECHRACQISLRAIRAKARRACVVRRMPDPG